MQPYLKAKVRLVRLHDIDRHGEIKVFIGQKLKIDTNPKFFDEKIDKYAVNVFAVEGKWKGKHLGHIATRYTDPEPSKNWGHAISAIVNWDVDRLSTYLKEFKPEFSLFMEVTGVCEEDTTHRPGGSRISVIICIDKSAVIDLENLLMELMKYLKSFSIEVERIF